MKWRRDIYLLNWLATKKLLPNKKNYEWFLFSNSKKKKKKKQQQQIIYKYGVYMVAWCEFDNKNSSVEMGGPVTFIS